jgi:hypothetical protein
VRKVVDLTIQLSGRDPQAQRLLARRPIDGDQATVSGRLARSGHEIRIVVEHRGGKYRVVSVTVAAPEGGEVTSAVLGIAVKEAANEALAQAWSLFNVTGYQPEDVLDPGVLRADFMRQQRRRTLDDAFLRRVADVHRAAEQAGERSVTGAVAQEFYVSQAQAERYVRAARKRGLLAASPRSKRAGRG